MDGWGTVEGRTIVVYLPGVANLAAALTHLKIERQGAGTPSVLVATDGQLVELDLELIYRHEILGPLWNAFRWRLQNADGSTTEDWHGPVGVPIEHCTLDEVRLGVGKRLRLLRGRFRKEAGGSATSHKLEGLKDEDASPRLYSSWWLRASSGEVQRVRRPGSSGGDGYTPATGTFKTNPFAAAPATNDLMELWRPVKENPTVEVVEDGINNTARYLPYEDTFIFSTSYEKSLYTLPRQIRDRSVQRVDIALGEFGDEPGWQKAPNFSVRREGGDLVLDLRPSMGSYSYTVTQLVRVTYITTPDLFDDYNTIWPVPLDWAVSLASLQTLNEFATLTDIEDVSHIFTTQGAIRDEALAATNEHRPVPTPRQEYPI